MARPLRIERTGVWYHVTGRGIERRNIFTDVRDRQHWLELLAETAGMFQVLVHGYVQMDNHFHLLLELREPNLSRAMHWFNVSYSVWFNRRHKRVGPLFQGRYKAVLVDPEGWGLDVSRYLHLNPVRIKMLGLGKGERQADRIGAGARPASDMVQKNVGNRGREQPQARFLMTRPSFAGVVKAVERVRGEKWEGFRDEYGDWGRDLVLYLGRRECGLKLQELGGLDYAAVSAAVKRFDCRLGKNAK